MLDTRGKESFPGIALHLRRDGSIMVSYDDDLQYKLDFQHETGSFQYASDSNSTFRFPSSKIRIHDTTTLLVENKESSKVKKVMPRFVYKVVIKYETQCLNSLC